MRENVLHLMNGNHEYKFQKCCYLHNIWRLNYESPSPIGVQGIN